MCRRCHAALLNLSEAAAGGGNVRLVNGETPSAFNPLWSADNASIFFSVDRLGVVMNIFEVDLDGRNYRRLTAGPKIDLHPSVSPDGSKLAFESNRDGNYEIYVMNLR